MFNGDDNELTVASTLGNKSDNKVCQNLSKHDCCCCCCESLIIGVHSF